MQSQKLFNKSMSSVRVAVEWPFGEVITYFASNNFKKNLKIALKSVAKLYVVSCLLFNGRAWLYNSKTALYFNIQLPSLDDYFSQSLNMN